MKYDYLHINQFCNHACLELYQKKESILFFEEYSNWLDRHYKLFKSFYYPPIIQKEQNSFYFLYNRIDQLKCFLQYSDKAKDAVINYLNSGTEDEIYISKWLNRYEDLGMALLLFDENTIEVNQNSLTNYFTIKGLKFSAIDFEFIVKFKSIFDSIYWKGNDNL